jgi:predicted nucleotidyltransferase
MIDLIERNTPALIALCRQFGVKKLDLFGSAANGTFIHGKSDIDFVIEFFDGNPDFDLQFFGFAHAAEDIVGHYVDLLTRSKLRDPYLYASIYHTMESIYDADRDSQAAA